MFDQLEQFLQHVLPDNGAFIYTWKRPGDDGMSQAVARSRSDLALAVLNLSRRGFDTYFACSAFTGNPIYVDRKGTQVARFRTAEQTVGTKALWMDIDVGPEPKKKYKTLEQAEEALFAWLDTHNLPEPTIVYSGGGLHIYWVLDRVVARAEWESLATRLKAFAEQTGLDVDPSRTADIASILRPPETLNYKREKAGEPVMLSELQPPVNVQHFAALLPWIDPPPRQQTHAPTVKNKYTNIYTDVPSSAVQIVGACNWLKEVGPTLRGHVSEPVWYRMLGILAFAEDGADLAQEWSMGHPGWDYDETEMKMEQARANQSGPTTCATAEREWRTLCQGCPHKGKITTPLQLGRPQPPTRQALTEMAKAETPASPTAAAEDTPTAMLAWPYLWSTTGGVLQHMTVGEDTVENVELYPYPLFIESMRRAELSGMAHAMLRHWAPHDGWREANVPAGDLNADGAFRMLGNAHIEVSPFNYKPFLLFMSEAKQAYRETRRTELQHETFGWKDDGFLIGDTLIMGEIQGKAGISKELLKYADKLKAVGSLDAWKIACQQLFKPGYEYQAFALLCGFGSTLMRFAPYPGGIYSVVSKASGQGKTLGAEAATSIWGAPQSLWVSHRDAKNSAGDTLKSQFRSFALFKNLPVIVDELRESDAEQLRGFITGFTDGSPPRGLTRDGVMRETFGSWSTLMQVTSNKSLTDLATANNDPAAANRVFEIQAKLPADADPASANAIRKGFRENYGHAGVTFIKHLMKPERFAWAEAQVRLLVDQYTNTLQQKRDDRAGGDRFIASLFAVCVVAGQLCTELGLLQVDTDHLMTWAFGRWDSQSKQIEESHMGSPDILSAFLRDHWQNTIDIHPGADGEQGRVPRDLVRQPLLGRRDLSTGVFLIDRNAFQRWCTQKNQHFLGIGDELTRLGILTNKTARRNLGTGTPYAGTGQAPVWVLDSSHPAMSGIARDVAATPETAPANVHQLGATQAKKGA